MKTTILQQMPVVLVEAMNTIAQHHVAKINEAAKKLADDCVLIMKLGGTAKEILRADKEQIGTELLYQKKETVREWASPTAQGLMLLDILLETSEEKSGTQRSVLLLIVTEDEHSLPVIVQLPEEKPVTKPSLLAFDGDTMINSRGRGSA